MRAARVRSSALELRAASAGACPATAGSVEGGPSPLGSSSSCTRLSSRPWIFRMATRIFSWVSRSSSCSSSISSRRFELRLGGASVGAVGAKGHIVDNLVDNLWKSNVSECSLTSPLKNPHPSAPGQHLLQGNIVVETRHFVDNCHCRYPRRSGSWPIVGPPRRHGQPTPRKLYYDGVVSSTTMVLYGIRSGSQGGPYGKTHSPPGVTARGINLGSTRGVMFTSLPQRYCRQSGTWAWMMSFRGTSHPTASLIAVHSSSCASGTQLSKAKPQLWALSPGLLAGQRDFPASQRALS